MNLRRRRLLLLARRAAGAAVTNETVAFNGTSATNGSPTGGSLPGILTDSSDFTYVDGTDFGDGPTVNVPGAFVDLVALTTVSSFDILVRCSVTSLDAGDSAISAFTISGGAVSPTNKAIPATITITDIRVGPFTKSGGGTWTAAQFNAMTVAQIVVESTSGIARIYKLWAEATA